MPMPWNFVDRVALSFFLLKINKNQVLGGDIKSTPQTHGTIEVYRFLAINHNTCQVYSERWGYRLLKPQTVGIFCRFFFCLCEMFLAVWCT